MEVQNIVQEVVIKTIPQKKKGKMIVWGDLTKAEKRREVKGKGEKERLYPSECRVTKNSKGR